MGPTRFWTSACMAALLFLAACHQGTARLTDAELRESYYFIRLQVGAALSGDSSGFAEFATAYRGSAAADSFLLDRWRAMRVGFSATLGELGYGTGPFQSSYGDRERSALKRFQADLGIRVTGMLDSLTILH